MCTYCPPNYIRGTLYQEPYICPPSRIKAKAGRDTLEEITNIGSLVEQKETSIGQCENLPLVVQTEHVYLKVMTL